MHAVLLAYNGWWMSPTLDEPAHVVAGISHWQRADFSLYRVNPPLVRQVAAVPVLLVGQDYELPERLNGVTDRNEFRLGEAWMEQNGRRSLWLVTLARWACIPFSLLGAITCFWWARDLFGQSAGIAAAALWCFSPMVLGHASLLTPDVPAAALGLLACYSFWLWLQQPTFGANCLLMQESKLRAVIASRKVGWGLCRFHCLMITCWVSITSSEILKTSGDLRICEASYKRIGW